MFLKNLSEKIKISEARRYILEKTKNHAGRYTKSHVLQYCTKKNTWKKHKIIGSYLRNNKQKKEVCWVAINKTRKSLKLQD